MCGSSRSCRRRSASPRCDLLAQGEKPLAVLEWCNDGMRLVGERYEKGTYFMAALIMAGEIMRQATDLITPFLEQTQAVESPVAKALVATVHGDIHDLGKNLFILMLKCNGFSVLDLGVDVPAEEIVEKARGGGVDVVGLSTTLTSGIEELKATVAKLKALPEPRPKVIIGGAVVDAHVQKFVKADAWAVDAHTGARMCLEMKFGGK